MSDVDTTPAEGENWWTVGQKWAMENGIINGVGQADGTVTLAPQGNAIRSHVAQMFMNFMTKVGI